MQLSVLVMPGRGVVVGIYAGGAKYSTPPQNGVKRKVDVINSYLEVGGRVNYLKKN